MGGAEMPPEVDKITSSRLENGVFSVSRARNGNITDTYIIEMEAEDGAVEPGYALKIGEASRYDELAGSAAVMRKVGEETGIPVPDIVEMDVNCGTVGRPFYITEYVHGFNPERFYTHFEDATRETLFTEAGKYLGELHAKASPERFGKLVSDNGHDLYLENSSRDWSEFLHDDMMARLGSLMYSRYDRDGVVERVQDWIERELPVQGPVEPAVCHQDYRPGNMIIGDDGSINSVLDWDFASVSDPAYELVKTESVIEIEWGEEPGAEEAIEAFREGYNDSRELPQMVEYRRPLYKTCTVVEIIHNLHTRMDDEMITDELVELWVDTLEKSIEV